MLPQRTDCEILENSQENVCDAVYFSKVASLHCTDCNSALNKLHHRFFLEEMLKIMYLQENLLSG